ncbi:MAG: polysaccharide pyruvyl transferase family protein [Candidatus Aenigmatarchaeota archaeon]
MYRILYLLGNQPDNLGDFIQNLNIIRTFQHLGEVIVDDHYLNNKQIKELGLSDRNLLSRNASLSNLRKFSGLVKIALSRSRPYHIILRVPTAREFKYDIKTVIRELKLLLVLALLHFKKIKIYQFGMTCDSSKLRGILLQIVRIQSKLHDIYAVRDINLYHKLKALRFDNIYYCPDIFYWDWNVCSGRTPNITQMEYRNRTILFSLRRRLPDHPNPLEFERKLREKVKAIIDSLSEDIRIVFSYQVPEDYEWNRFLFENYKGRYNCEFVNYCLTKEMADDLYSNCDLIISNRQHCLLYGAKLGTPIMALTDPKVHWKLRGALEDLNVIEFLADINDDNASVIKKCHILLQRKIAISEKLLTAVEKKKEEAARFLREQVGLEI